MITPLVSLLLIIFAAQAKAQTLVYVPLEEHESTSQH
jgi:hypothetical protein